MISPTKLAIAVVHRKNSIAAPVILPVVLALPMLAIPITQRANNVRLQRAQLDETINQFNTTVLTAVQEVDNAMSSYKNSIKQIVACREMLNQGKEAFKLSLDLYKQGLSPFQNVLDAQRSLLSYENSLVQAQGYSLLCLIQMYQALGGGW